VFDAVRRDVTWATTYINDTQNKTAAKPICSAAA